MTAASHEERDRLLHITPVLLDTLKQMQLDGHAPASMILHMQKWGVPKSGAIMALRLSGSMTLGEAKMAVHFSEAYAYRREEDEAFEESAIAALEDLNRSEAA